MVVNFFGSNILLPLPKVFRGPGGFTKVRQASRNNFFLWSVEIRLDGAELCPQKEKVNESKSNDYWHVSVWAPKQRTTTETCGDINLQVAKHSLFVEYGVLENDEQCRQSGWQARYHASCHSLKRTDWFICTFGVLGKSFRDLIFLLSGLCNVFCTVSGQSVRRNFGHNSAPSRWICMKLAGNSSYQPPGPV